MILYIFYISLCLILSFFVTTFSIGSVVYIQIHASNNRGLIVVHPRGSSHVSRRDVRGSVALIGGGEVVVIVSRSNTLNSRNDKRGP